jgi:hypothetical protein
MSANSRHRAARPQVFRESPRAGSPVAVSGSPPFYTSPVHYRRYRRSRLAPVGVCGSGLIGNGILRGSDRGGVAGHAEGREPGAGRAHEHGLGAAGDDEAAEDVVGPGADLAARGDVGEAGGLGRGRTAGASANNAAASRRRGRTLMGEGAETETTRWVPAGMAELMRAAEGLRGRDGFATKPWR